MRLRIVNDVRAVIDPYRRRSEQIAFVGPLRQIRRTIDAVAVTGSVITCAVPVGRAVEIKPAVELLQTTVMRINNFPVRISPGLDIADGNGARRRRTLTAPQGQNGQQKKRHHPAIMRERHPVFWYGGQIRFQR